MGAVSSALECRQVLYSGTVQGVGFRYSTRSIARNYEITGFVRNLPDGRVEVVAEGPADQLNGFLDEVGDRLSGHIHRTQCDGRPAQRQFANFGIRY
jgi:acylphosphatase